MVSAEIKVRQIPESHLFQGFWPEACIDKHTYGDDAVAQQYLFERRYPRLL